jgi:hypothetical protein
MAVPMADPWVAWKALTTDATKVGDWVETKVFPQVVWRAEKLAASSVVSKAGKKAEM